MLPEKRRAGRAIRKRMRTARFIYQVLGVPLEAWQHDRLMLIQEWRRRG